jgi:type I restriction enzyme, R subunit
MGIGNKTNFLDLVENFILFDESSGKTTKIIARNHQFLGVNLAFEVVKRRKALSTSSQDTPSVPSAQFSSELQAPNASRSESMIQSVLSQQRNRLGVFWHTQGSGKSYSIAFLTEKILRKLGGYSFVIVTDRQELDRQIAETFVGVGAISPQQKVQATSGDHLGELLKGNNRYVFTLVHKFNQPGKEYSDRDNIIVISDEAHRTQYGTLAENMRDGLRNAGFIGFTGTPLMGSVEDQKTREMFGDYVSVYDFQRAVEDQATVPLYYDNRSEKLQLNTDDLNARISSEIAAHDLSDEDENRLMRRLGNDYLVLTAESRLDRIAEDLVAHYTTRWETGKAMLVCLDKLTAVKMHDLIDHYWKRAIAHQETQIKTATDEQDLHEQQRHLHWLKETEYAVVISKEQNEVKTFRDRGLNIEPHRQKIESRDLEDEFKKPDHPFRLVIVCAMWLTGFDVPTLATLYLDKAMQGHSLMQAIARANRVAEGKNNGLLVDYSGILKGLRAALAKYGSAANPHQDSAQQPTAPYDETIALAHSYAQAIENCTQYLHSLGCDLHQLQQAEGFDKISLLDAAVEAITTNDKTRARFEVLAREIFKKHTALINYPQLSTPYRLIQNTIEAICDELSPESSLTDLSAVLQSLQQLVSSTITVQPADHRPGGESGRIYDISNINFAALKAEFTKAARPNQTVQTLKQAIETRLKQMIAQNPTRINFYDRYQKIIYEYNQETDRVTIEQTFEQLLSLVEQLSTEDTRAIREGLNEDHLAIFDLLCQQKDSLSSKNRDRIKQVARSLFDAITTELHRLENWGDKDTTRAQIKTFVHNYLYDETKGLPIEDYTEDDVQEVTNVIFLHVYEQFANSRKAA